jgi:hypothetical protein
MKVVGVWHLRKKKGKWGWKSVLELNGNMENIMRME